jgi:hypothetical protein
MVYDSGIKSETDGQEEEKSSEKADMHGFI